MSVWLTVIGIGEDGLAGLGEAARHAVSAAELLIGGRRHLGMVPATPGQERLEWPSPFDVSAVLARRGTPVCVLASGDPMLFGVGAVLARHVPADEMRVLPAASAFALAASRMGWPMQDVATLSLVGRPLETVLRHAHDGARLLLLSADGGTPASLAALLVTHCFGRSRIDVLENMGGANEHRRSGMAANWPHARCAGLNVLAVTCVPDDGRRGWPVVAGLPDEAYENDGQLTKRDVRAVTLAHLAPLPGELLWDVGAGCGSIGIEWMRSHPTCRALAIEANDTRRGLIARNRDALGVPGLTIIAGRAPDALTGLEQPDAIFIGGGLTSDGTVERCWEALGLGGRLVANAVTLQSEAALTGLRARLGGTLTRLSVSEASQIGGFDGWRPAMPVTIWSTGKASTSF